MYIYYVVSVLILETVKSDKISTPTKPDYSITYSSDFDLSNCRNSNDVNPLRPPDRLKINVKLPGLSSSSCVDLEVTEMHIHLSVSFISLIIFK